MKDVATSEESDDEVLDYLSEYIEESYEKNQQPDSELASKMKVLRILENYVKGPFNTEIERLGLRLNAVLPFGSTTTNLGTPGGDLDIVISLTQLVRMKKANRGRRDRVPNSVLTPLCLELKRNALGQLFKTIEHIATAKVPIIAGEFMGVELDISVEISNYPPPAYIAGQMINGYGEFDDRFDPLCAFVKKWMKHLAKSCASAKEERKVKRYLPSSSTSTLLVIHFLQHERIIPNLYKTHNELFKEDRVTWGMVAHWEENEFHIPKKDVEEWEDNHKEDTDSTLGELFRGFLIYYTEVVPLTKYVLDMVTGKVILKRNFEIDSDDWTTLFINNINDKMNPGKQVDQVAQFVNILRIALEELDTCVIPNQSVSRILNMRLRFKKEKPGILYNKVFTVLTEAQNQKEPKKKNRGK